MSWQAGRDADIEEETKAWKIRMNKIRNMRTDFGFGKKMGYVLNEIQQYKYSVIL